MAKKKKSRSAKKTTGGIPKAVRKASSTIKKHLHKLEQIKKKEEACLKKTAGQIRDLKGLL